MNVNLVLKLDEKSESEEGEISKQDIVLSKCSKETFVRLVYRR